MQNSVVMLTFCFWWKIPFLGIFCPKYQNCVPRLRALSHMKLHHGVKFLISTRVEKNWCHTWVSTQGKTNIFLLHFTPGWNYICKDLQHILQKCYTEKARFICSYRIIYKSHTCEEGGHISEFLFGIYWWTWKSYNY